MKKFIVYIALFCLLSCSKDEQQNNQNFINIQLDLGQVNEYANDYNFSDFKIKIYISKEDYFNEVNPIFSDDFDNTGTISISENLDAKSYYIDIYTEDKILSNWKVTDLNVGSSNIIVFYPNNGNSDFFNTVYIEDNRKFVGDWSFSTYESTNSDNSERTNKTTLSINKDFTAQSYENFNGIDYILNFKIQNNGYLNLIDIKPNSESYPVSTINLDALILQVNDLGLLSFLNYSGDDALYSRN